MDILPHADKSKNRWAIWIKNSVRVGNSMRLMVEYAPSRILNYLRLLDHVGVIDCFGRETIREIERLPFLNKMSGDAE